METCAMDLHGPGVVASVSVQQTTNHAASVGENSSNPSSSHDAPDPALAFAKSRTAASRSACCGRSLAKNETTLPVCFHAGSRAPSVLAIATACSLLSVRRHRVAVVGGGDEDDIAFIRRDSRVEHLVAQSELGAGRCTPSESRSGGGEDGGASRRCRMTGNARPAIAASAMADAS